MSGLDGITACTIAGSDPSGAAGIWSDLLTFAVLGVRGFPVVTAVTAQNSHECRGAWGIPAGAVALQLATLLSDVDIRAFKTGMLWDSRVIRDVASGIPRSALLVVDPVMIASCGSRLLSEEAVGDLSELLVPRSTVVTPNLAEAAVLAGTGKITSLRGMREAGRRILDLGAAYVVVKGGHLPGGPAADLLVGKDGEQVFTGDRYPGDVHGTGCCFSAAITAYLAGGATVPAACAGAKKFVSRAIRSAWMTGGGHLMIDPRTPWNQAPER